MSTEQEFAMKTLIILCLLALIVVQLTGGKSLQTERTNNYSQHLSALQNENYSYDYDEALPSTNGRGDLSPNYDSLAPEGGKTPEGRKSRRSHEVLDDEDNYDYTYGDPEVDYNYNDTQGSDEATDDEIGKEDEEMEVEEKEEEGQKEEKEDDMPSSSEEEDLSAESEKRQPREEEVARAVKSIVEWVIRNWLRAKDIRDHWKETKNRLKKNWNQIRDAGKRIRYTLGKILRKFGREIEEGLKYCYIKVDANNQSIEIHGFEVVQKLERLLELGNKIVAALFEVIGQKVVELRDHYDGNVAIVRSGERRQSDNIVDYRSAAAIEASSENALESINVFEDQEVKQKLNLLVRENILSLSEVEILKNTASEQTERVKGQRLLL
ncbi:hypothetical protein SK128_019218 [Halocaridina rubra]|uniref:Uncharacterized protein n=1 Tax=Halocaridina rubra TaxID=373956 RepID=A0AAN9ADW6_HALRR